MEYDAAHSCDVGEVFAICQTAQKKYITKIKIKKLDKRVHQPIHCDRCGVYADYLDPMFPQYSDFNLCKKCVAFLES